MIQHSKSEKASKKNKLDILSINKRITERILKNSNRIITNLSGIKLNDLEIPLLKCEWKHRLSIIPKEGEMTVINEDIFDQMGSKKWENGLFS